MLEGTEPLVYRFLIHLRLSPSNTQVWELILCLVVESGLENG